MAINLNDTIGQLENLKSKAFSPEVLSGLEKAKEEFEVMNIDMVGRVPPIPKDITKKLKDLKPGLDKLIKGGGVDLAGIAAASIPPGLTGNLGALEDVSARLKLSPDLLSELPRVGEELNNGLKGLAPALSDFPKEMDEAVPLFLKGASTVTANLQQQIPGIMKPLAEVTESLPAAAEKMKPALESATQQALAAISGSDVQEAFNNVALTLPTPAAMAEVTAEISKATNAIFPELEKINTDEIKSIMSAQLDGIKGDIGGITANLSATLGGMNLPDLTLPDIGGLISAGLGGITGGLGDINAALGALGGALPSVGSLDLGGLNLGSVGLGAIQGKITANFDNALTKVTGSPVLDMLHGATKSSLTAKLSLGLPDIPAADFISNSILGEVTNGTIGGAMGILSGGADAFNLGIDVTANFADLEGKIKGLADGFGTAGAMLSGGVGDIPANISSSAIVSGATTLAKTNPVVNSVEEINTEVLSATKEPEALEFSWTETYSGQIVNKDTIQPQDYYNYIILPDGTIQRDKQISTDELIRCAIVAGFTVCETEDLEGEAELNPDSVTYAQTLSTKKIIGEVIAAYPGIAVYGAGEADPRNPSDNPGVDIDKIRRTIDGGGSSPPGTPIAQPDGLARGLSTNDRVKYVSGFESKTRNLNLTPKLMKALINAATDADVYITISSGGQMALAEAKRRGGRKSGSKWFLPGIKKAVRTGSTRHDNGNAADVYIYSDKGRTTLLPAGKSLTKKPPAKAYNFLRACVSQGMTGIGTGPGYMDGTLAHVGYGSNVRWGKYAPSYEQRRANTPTWLKAI
jgi:hypothetical protein